MARLEEIYSSANEPKIKLQAQKELNRIHRVYDAPDTEEQSGELQNEIEKAINCLSPLYEGDWGLIELSSRAAEEIANSRRKEKEATGA